MFDFSVFQISNRNISNLRTFLCLKFIQLWSVRYQLRLKSDRKIKLKRNYETAWKKVRWYQDKEMNQQVITEGSTPEMIWFILDKYQRGNEHG